MFLSAAKPITGLNGKTFLKFSIYEPMVERFTMGIILYPTLKNPAADILGLFKFIASVIWLICFKNSKLIIIIDYNSIRKDYLILNRVY